MELQSQNSIARIISTSSARKALSVFESMTVFSMSTEKKSVLNVDIF